VSTSYANVAPGKKLSELPQNETISLNGNFEIQMRISASSLNEPKNKYVFDMNSNGLVVLGD